MESSMNTKLTINLKDGILDVTGSEDFVRSIYDDFKNEIEKRQLIAGNVPRQIEPAGVDEAATTIDTQALPTRKRASSREKSRTKYKPKFDPGLDIGGLPAFYGAVSPVNNFEKLLTFGMFLREQRGMESFSQDHIFTCFQAMREQTKTPEAFEQAFRDAQNRTHWIHANSMQDISIRIPGMNHFETMKKRKAAT
jgi:hypothetical protein